MNRRSLVIGASAIGLAVFAGGTIVTTRSRRAQAPDATPPVDAQILLRGHAPAFGPPTAPVALVEFFDPSCEACRAFHPVIKDILARHPQQVRVVLRYAAFHEGSDTAIAILETARMQDRFEPVLEALLARQPDWAVHGAPRLDLAWQIAAAAGLDVARAQRMRLSPDIVGILNQDAADIETLGIRRTPTFFLNGRQLGRVTFDSLRSDVDAAVTAA